MGMTYCQGVCLACYNFAARYRGHAGQCGACLRELPLKGGYCRLFWRQAGHDRDNAATDARSAVVLAPYLPLVRHHQLFFAGMEQRRGAGSAAALWPEVPPAQAAASLCRAKARS